MPTCTARAADAEHAALPSIAVAEPAAVTADVATENRRWVQGLSGSRQARECAVRELYPLLIRVARSEAHRRSGEGRLTGPELDDIAEQAAGDALLKICEKIGTFRGECRFTTWAYKFVAFDVATKLNRHFWRRRTVPLDAAEWDSLPSRIGIEPEQEAESRDLAAAVSRAVRGSLTARQRAVFVALVIDGAPMDEVGHAMDATSNAIYKTMFDARRKLRAVLEAGGYLSQLPT